MDSKWINVLLIDEDYDELQLIHEIFKEIRAKDYEFPYVPEDAISIITDLDDKTSKGKALRKENILENQSYVDDEVLGLIKFYIKERERLKNELRVVSLMFTKIGGEKFAILAREISEENVEIVIKYLNHKAI